MTAEFYVIRDGEVVPLPEADFPLVESWNKRVGKRSKQYQHFHTREALQLIIYPQGITINAIGVMPRIKQYDKLPTGRRSVKARKDQKTDSLCDSPRPLRYE